MLTRIAHATDFSPDSTVAFLHALRLALATRSRLDILHVRGEGQSAGWGQFPHVREPCVRWGLLEQGASPDMIETRLGVHVAKVDVTDHDAVSGLSRFFLSHRPDLLVVASHARHGVGRWLHGSVSEDLARRTHVPTLLIQTGTTGFVDADTGHMSLKRVLLPVVAAPSPARAYLLLAGMLASLGVPSGAIDIVTVGDSVADVMEESGRPRQVEQLTGSPVDAILEAAQARMADLIAMPTLGRHGVLDVFRGSTTSRVLAEAPCPVLALPLIGA